MNRVFPVDLGITPTSGDRRTQIAFREGIEHDSRNTVKIERKRGQEKRKALYRARTSQRSVSALLDHLSVVFHSDFESATYGPSSNRSTISTGTWSRRCETSPKTLRISSDSWPGDSLRHHLPLRNRTSIHIFRCANR